MNELGKLLRRRSHEIGLSMSELARKAEKSRQTLHQLTLPSTQLPHLKTLVDIARVLRVHPLDLVAALFHDTAIRPKRAHLASCGCGMESLVGIAPSEVREVSAGAKFVHVWRVPNPGKHAWTGGQVRCIDDLVGEPGASRTAMLVPTHEAAALPRTPAAGVAQVEVEFTAPAEPGRFASWWLARPNTQGPLPSVEIPLVCEVQVVYTKSRVGPARG